MVRSPAQNAALRAASRERLLTAALEAFAEQGFDATTTRDIAQRAGVATGMLYHHFPGKDALLLAAFEHSVADVRATFAEARRGAPETRVAALIRAAADTIRAHLGFWRLGYATRYQPAAMAVLAPHLGAWQAEILQELTTYLVALRVPSPAIEALALFAQIDGMCQHYALDPAQYPLDDVAEQVIARYAAPNT